MSLMSGCSTRLHTQTHQCTHACAAVLQVAANWETGFSLLSWRQFLKYQLHLKKSSWTMSHWGSMTKSTSRYLPTVKIQLQHTQMWQISCYIVWPIFQHLCKSSKRSEQTFRRPETLCKTNMEMSLAAPNGIWISSQSLQRWKSWHVFSSESGSQGSSKHTLEYFTVFLPVTTDTFAHLLGRYYGEL